MYHDINKNTDITECNVVLYNKNQHEKKKNTDVTLTLAWVT